MGVRLIPQLDYLHTLLPRNIHGYLDILGRRVSGMVSRLNVEGVASRGAQLGGLNVLYARRLAAFPRSIVG